MKYFKTLIFVIYFCIAPKILASEITYDIYHYPEKLHIILKFQGNKNGITEIKIPSNIWGHNLAKQIKNIQVLDEAIATKNLNIFSHKPNQIIKLSFDIQNIEVPRKDRLFLSQSKEEGFFFLHDFALIYPKLSAKQKVLIRYHSPKNKEVYFFTKNMKIGQKFITTLEELKGGLSIAGNKNLLQYMKLNNLTALGYNINSKNFANLKQILKTTINSQKGFCNCKSNTNSFIFIANQSDRQSYRGTLLENNQIIFLVPNILDNLKLKNLISHENLHKIIGNKEFIRFDQKSEQNFKWFSEGFTDYLALKNNYITKNITSEEYSSSYKEILKRYFSSPYKSLSYDQIALKYWQHPQAKQTIYDRGHIMAHELDLEIQAISNITLKNVICEIAKLFQNDKNLVFSKNILINSIKNLTKHDLTEKIDSLIDGNFVSPK